MFQLQTKDVNSWNMVIKAASALLEEVALEFHPDMITMRNMDPSHIAMLNLEWLKQSFDVYECDGEHIVTLRIDDLANIMKRASKGELIEMSLGEGNTLLIKVSNGFQREFVLHILESSHTAIPVPKVNFTAKIVMTLKGFKEAISDIETVSDEVNMKADTGTFVLSGSSEYGNVKVSITTATPDVKEITVSETSSASYSIEYIEKFIKALSSSLDYITIEFGNRLPIRIQAPLDDKGSKLEYYLATREE